MENKKALILAGNTGADADSLPNSMAFVAGRPFLDHQIRYLRDQGVEEVILAVNYGADLIKSYFRDGKRMGIHIIYSDEDKPLGTAGAIKNAQRYLCENPFFLLKGSSYSNVDLQNLWNYHHAHGDFTASLVNAGDKSHYKSFTLSDGKVVDISLQRTDDSGLMSSGIYLFNPKILSLIESGKKISLEREILPVLASQNQLYGYIHDGYFVDIRSPEDYLDFKREILGKMFLGREDTLRSALQKIVRSGINLVLVTDEERKLLGVVNNGIITEHLLQGGNLEDRLRNFMIQNPTTAQVSDSEERISAMMASGINHLPIVNENGSISEVRFMAEESKKETFPVLRGRAPLRISFAGGGTDLPYYFEIYGGVVISATIDKYNYATIMKRADGKVLISSDFDETSFDRANMKYDSHFDLIKAITKLVNPNFGFELHVHSDIPSGKGLGSSSSLGVLVAKLMGELAGLNYGDEDLARVAFEAETKELGIRGGWQDQYAAATGGFSFMEFTRDKKIIYPLRLKEEIINELDNHLVLCSVGGSHFSGDLHTTQERQFYENEKDAVARLNGMKDDAIEIRDALLRGNLMKMGELLNDSWEKKKLLNSGVSNPKIDELYNAGLDNGAIGGKLLGAGGAGYLLFFYHPNRRRQLRTALEELGGEMVDFNFESGGTKTWVSKR
jgi:D-glycero-alpha-D-manno-heptose-7-phosphate kinase